MIDYYSINKNKFLNNNTYNIGGKKVKKIHRISQFINILKT